MSSGGSLGCFGFGTRRDTNKHEWCEALQLWSRGLDGGHLAADVAVGFGLAFVDGVSAGDEKLAEVFPTKADVKGLLGRGDDEVYAACLIKDLDAEGSGDVEPAVGVYAKATY